MLERSSKRSETNPSQVAFLAVQKLIAESEHASAKNPAAVALGRRGGMRGGKARAAKLSARQKSDIARKAARARWNKTR
jgi:hypothetical protein